MSDPNANSTINIDSITVESTTSTFIVGALSFTAALAWRDAIQAIFTRLFGKATTVSSFIIYAVIITIIAVIVAVLISRNSKTITSSIQDDEED